MSGLTGLGIKSGCEVESSSSAAPGVPGTGCAAIAPVGDGQARAEVNGRGEVGREARDAGVDRVALIDDRRAQAGFGDRPGSCGLAQLPGSRLPGVTVPPHHR